VKLDEHDFEYGMLDEAKLEDLAEKKPLAEDIYEQHMLYSSLLESIYLQVPADEQSKYVSLLEQEVRNDSDFKLLVQADFKLPYSDPNSDDETCTCGGDGCAF
jgi:hypothetical protein